MYTVGASLYLRIAIILRLKIAERLNILGLGIDRKPAVAAADTTPPQLVAFSFTPSAVNVSASPQSVTVNATITDDLSGFSYGDVQFTGPNNQYVIGYFSRTSGNALNGTYQVTITVPRFVAAGVWKALVYLTDSAGNYSRLAASNLVTLGFPTDLTVTDTSPPVSPHR